MSSKFEEALLRSAEGDAPSAERRHATREAVMNAASFGAPGSGEPDVDPLDTAVPKSAAVGKLATAAAVAGAIGIGIGIAVLVLSSTPSAVPAATATPSTVPPSEEPAPSASAEPAVTPPASATAAPAAPASSAPRPKPSGSAVDPLRLEARLLEEARRCLDAGDTSCAAAKLAEHRATFARGALADEAALLRIEVARARGDVAGARKLAEELIREHPSGPYARRARAILAALPESE